MNQSLLAAWQWSYLLDDGYESFLKTLHREKDEPSQAMLDGQRFENLVNAALDGTPPPEKEKWREPVIALAEYLDGSQKQVDVYKNLMVDGMCFRAHGVLDFLKAGVIYDTKFSKNYHLNKYLNSPQWRMYFNLVPEAQRFEFLSSDGSYIYRETYYPWQAAEKPIEQDIHYFVEFLNRQNLMGVYKELWSVD